MSCSAGEPLISSLDYSSSLIESVISNFDSQNPLVSIAERNTDEGNIVKIISLPFKDQDQAIVNQQCIVYHFVSDLCNTDYVGCTA